MAAIIYIIVFIFILLFGMIGINVIYDIATAIIPIVSFMMVIMGIIVGFVVAIKNTFLVYKQVYTKKGKEK